MVGLFSWFAEAENKFFSLHLLFVFVFSIAAEMLFSGLTTFIYPALILIAVASFLYNYPIGSIKEHGLFSEYLIVLRVLWIVILSVFIEYVAYQFFERSAISLYMGIALVVGLLVLFYCHSNLQDKLVKCRGFK